MGQTSASIDYHNRLAQEWDQRYQKGVSRKRAEFFKRRFLPDLKPGLWLDAGCGTGFYSRMLATEGRQVVGIDAAPNMINVARERAKLTGQSECVSLETIETVENLEFSSKTFDGVISLSVVEYLSRPDLFLSEISRVTKNHGQIVLSLPHRQSTLRFAQSQVKNVYRPATGSSLDYLDLSQVSMRPHQIESWLANFGFRTEKIAGFDPLLPALVHPLLPPSLLYVLATKMAP